MIAFSRALKLTTGILITLLSVNRVFGQTVTVDNNTSGVTSKYTFEYTLSQPSNRANVFYLSPPLGYISFIDPGTQEQDKAYLELYVNNQPIPSSNWGIGAIWSSGVQISVSTNYQAGSNIKVVLKNGIITNPSSGDYTFNWSTTQGNGATIESFSKQITAGKGRITIVATSGHPINSGWTWSNGLITASQNVNIDASVIETYLASGNLTLDASQITIDESITSSGAGRSLTLKSEGAISLAASKTITTANGDVIFWSDSDVNLSGAITLGDNATINTANGSTASGLTGGGNIVLAGGADNGSNGGVASDGIPDGFAYNATGNGIKLGTTSANTTSLYSGGGNITLRGTSTLAGFPNVNLVGLYQFGKLIANSGKGAIDIRGTANDLYGINFVDPQSNVDSGDKNLVLISDKASGDAIKITGVSTNNIGVIFNFFNPKEILATGGGNISITGTAGSGNGVSLSNLDILASSGSITIDGGTRGIIIQNKGARLGSRAGTGITSSTANISLIGNVLTYMPLVGSGFTNDVTTTGSLTLQPAGTSFTSTFLFPSSLKIANTVSGLTLGKSTNTQTIEISAATTIPGPITVFGGAVRVNAPLTATNNTISITSATSLTDGTSGFLVANNLSLNGAGTVTIDQANNDVNTLAAGSSSARLGALSFFDKDDLTIGTVNTPGIYSSGNILIESGVGDINLTEPVNTTSTTTTATGYAGAIVLNAGKSTAVGTDTGGDIKVSGNGAVSAPNGIAKLYSAKETTSTGLNTLAGGSAQIRSNVDETTTTFSPVLTASGGTKYALYRVAATISLSESTITINALSNQAYTGSAITPLPVIKNSGTTLVKDTDYTLAYSGNTNVGTATVTITGIGGYSGTRTVNFTITAKPLTITGLTGVNKEYNGNATATATGTAALSGVIGSDVVTVSGTPTYTFIQSGVGTGIGITTTGYTLGGAGAGNYSLTQPSLTANITAKALTITGLTGVNKEYNGTRVATASGTAALTGILGSDVVTLAGTPAYTFAQAEVGTAIGITTTGYTITGAAAGNYSLTQPSLTANITAKALTITGLTGVNKEYNGTRVATASGTAALTGILGSDVVTLAGTPTYTFAQAEVGTAIGITTTGYTITGAAAGNYSLTQPSLTANITAKALTVTGLSGVNKEYNGNATATATGTAALSGIIGSDVVTLTGTPTYTFIQSGVGTAIGITTTGYTITGAAAGNYSLTQPSLTANIRTKALTITGLMGVNKEYNGTRVAAATGTAALTGILGSDVVTVSGTPTYTFAQAEVGTAIGITTTGYTITGAAAGNYSLTQPSLTSNITAKAIAVTPNSNQRKVYGETDPVFTYTFSGDIAGQTPGFDNSLTRAQGESVGAYAIGLGSLSLKDNGLFKVANYSLVLTPGVDFTIGKAPLVAKVNADSKFVTQTDATGYTGLTYSGFKFGEGPSVLNTTNLVISRTNSSQQAAGTYANVLVGSGITASNYTITYQPGSYTIVAADELLVNLGNREVIYGETAVYQVVSAGYFSSSGQRVVDLTSNTQVQGRKVIVTDGASGGAEFNIGIGSSVLSGSGKVSVGTYPLVAENTVLTSANFSNKLVLQGNLEVKTKSLGVSVSGGKSKPYDGNVQMLSLTLSLATALTGDEVSAVGTGVYAGKNVGASNYTVSGITLSGSDAFNYVVQGGSGAQITGTDGQITTRSLAVVPTVAQSKAFGEADPILTYTYSGQVSGEVPGFSGALSRLTGQTEGAYGITRGTLGLVDSGNFLVTNYSLDFTAGVNFTIVGANQLLVKLSPTEVSYGAAPQYGVASVGYFSSGNQFVDLTANTQLSGTRLTVSDGASGTAVFDVAVVSPQRSTSTTLKAGNYTLAAENIVETSPNFGNTVVLQGTLKVNPKQLSVSVSGGKVKGYDGNALMQNLALSLSGSIQGDVVAVQGSGQYDSKNVGSRGYTVSSIALSGADAANYFIQGGTTASVQGADGEITKRALTLTPNSGQKKGFGSADPVFTYTFSGQVPGESLTFGGLLSRASGEAVGTYGITLGTLSAGGNYNLVLAGTVQFEIQAVDTDGDGVLDLKEIEDKTDPINPCSLVVEHQTEPLGIQNWDRLDCDGDGVSNGNEIKSTLKNRAPGVSFGSQDTDRDGIPDYLDTDDDGDGVLTKNELPDRDKDGKPDDAVDTDGDGIPDYLDTDDDGDGILTKSELPDRDGDGKPDDAVDTDGDGIPDYMDADDDGDGTLTKNQLMDTDQDGIPDYFDSDDDGDGVPDYIEVIDGTDINDADDVKDTDRDGVPDYVETQQGTSPSNPQDFKDSDGDGVPDYVENVQGTDPKDPSGNKDTDGDGVPDYVEVQQGTNPTIASDAKDSDKDGVADHIQFRSLRVTKREDVVLLWGDKNYRSALPKAVEVTLYSGAKATLEVVWTATETVNIFKRGTTELKGTIVLPKGVYNPYKVNGLVRLVVLPKPAPRDVTITNTTFVGSTTVFFIPVGAFVVNDPVDNIHVVSFLGDGYDNKFFSIKDNILYWNSAERAPGKTTFSIVVRVTDRDGNTLDKFFTITRTRKDFSSLTITNAYSPNGDGANDAWGVPEIRFYEGARISVYDRGGSRLFYTENPDIRWDGTYNGKEMPVGSYFWVIEIVETGEMRRGMLNLIRK